MSVEDPEAALSELLAVYAQPQPWEHRHPLVALRAAALLRDIPAKTYRPSGSRDGQTISSRLRRSHFGITTVLHQAVTLLELPEPPATYGLGPHFASQRKHARKALRAGVTWTLVTEAAQRDHLLELVDARERVRVQADFSPEEVTGLLDNDLWLAAWQGERPLLLAVAAVDGEWSMLRYFCRLESSRVAGSTRYLMTGVLAEELAARGARFACDFVSPFRLPPGLRKFSRMVGFRTHRVQMK